MPKPDNFTELKDFTVNDLLTELMHRGHKEETLIRILARVAGRDWRSFDLELISGQLEDRQMIIFTGCDYSFDDMVFDLDNILRARILQKQDKEGRLGQQHDLF